MSLIEAVPRILQYKAFFEQSSLPMEIYSRAGECIAVNQAWEKFFDTKFAELKNYNILQDQQLVQSGLMPYLHRAYAGESVESPAFFYDPTETRKFGRARWLETYMFPVTNSMGDVCALGMIIKDVTDLQQALKARDEFLSIASHELRTPLTPMKMQMQTLMKILRRSEIDPPSPENICRVLENADKQIQRMEALIDNLLDVSRITAGKLTLNLEPVNIVTMIHEVCGRYTEIDLSIETVIPESKKSVFGVWDRLRIEQVMVNLLNNAVKYAPRAPVQVRLTCQDGTALMSVSDAGPGIAPDAVERVFERYERANGNRTVGGLGLGLFIARQIVEAHHGKIWVESLPGSGACFFVQLPLAIEH